MADNDTPAVNPPANPPGDSPATPPVTPPTVPPTHEPVSSPPTPTPNADTGARVDRLEGLITSLTETVARLIPSDDKPVKRPWTHAGSKRRDRE